MGLRLEEVPKRTTISPPSAYKHPPCLWVLCTFQGPQSLLLQEALPDVLIHRCLSVRAHPRPGAPGLSHLSVHAHTRCPAQGRLHAHPASATPCTQPLVLSSQQPVSRPPHHWSAAQQATQSLLVTGLREPRAHRCCLLGVACLRIRGTQVKQRERRQGRKQTEERRGTRDPGLSAPGQQLHTPHSRTRAAKAPCVSKPAVDPSLRGTQGDSALGGHPGEGEEEWVTPEGLFTSWWDALRRPRASPAVRYQTCSGPSHKQLLEKK